MTSSLQNATKTASTPGLTIGGRIITQSATRLAVINPATAAPFTDVPQATTADLDAAIVAARAAAGPWASTDLAVRQRYVLTLVDHVRANIDELARLVTLEQGKPLTKAAGEIESGLRGLTYYAALDIPVEVIRDDNTERIEVHRPPVGIVAGITAWNYPLLLALWKIGPALVAGNPIIVKPSPQTPVATLRLGELAQEVLPEGVIQVLAGGDELGRSIATHSGIQKISFTGSERAGTSIMSAAGPTLKRLTLELGGNDAGIVLDDVEVSTIAADLYWGALSNCGQVCAGLKRLYVPEALAGQVEEALAEIAATVRVGNGLDDGIDMGPIQNASQLTKVRGYVEDARRRGADIYFEGQIPEGPGYFHPITLVRNISDDVALTREEQFGPVLPILTYTDLDDVIARANNSPLALGASVWSPDEDRARAVAARVQAGTVWINQHPMLSPDVPFGGIKQSGLGVEQSLHGVLQYTDYRVVRIKR